MGAIPLSALIMVGSLTVYILCNLLTLYLACAQCQPQPHDDPDPTAGIRQNVIIVMVRNSSTGMQICLMSTGNSLRLNKSVDILNHYLPPECENSHLCGILHFEHSGISYYIIPSIGGFVVLSDTIKANNTGHTGTDKMQTSFINITKKCNPTQAFYAGPEGRHHIVIVCMDLQIRPHGTLHYLQYYFSPANEGRGSILRSTNLLVQSERIYNPETVSKVIYVRKQERCAEYDNLYFIDDSYILHYPFNAFDSEFISSNHPLHNCSNGQPSIEYYGNDSLLIRCSDNQGVLYDSCTSQFSYPAPGSVPYPCTNWDTIIFRNGSQLTLNRPGHDVTLKLPFNDLTFGKCVQGVNHPIFIASSADGSIFIAPFDGNSNNFTKVKSGNCSKNHSTCQYRPVFSKNQLVFGVFDPANDTVAVVDLTLTCIEQPFIMRIHTPFTPELMSISLGHGTLNYSCPVLQLNTLDLTTTAKGIPEGETTIIHPTTSLDMELISLGVALSLATVPAIAIIVMVMIIVMAVITYAHYKSRKFNNQVNDSPFKFHASAEMAAVTDHDIDLSHKEYCNSEEISKDPDKPHAMQSSSSLIQI